MWKNEIRKAEKLNSYDETVAFAMVLDELDFFRNTREMLRFFEKPYNFQKMYEDMLKMVEEHLGEKGSITEIIDIEELADKAEDYLRGL
jgi:hypothetical protein